MTNRTPLLEAQRRARRRRVASRQCRTCGTLHTLHVVRHPAGHVVICSHCGEVTLAARLVRPA